MRALGPVAAIAGVTVRRRVNDALVVATAQAAGAAALAIAVVVKLTRVLMLALMVATASVVVRHARGAVEGEKLPPIVPLFGLGSAIRLEKLLGSGLRAMAVGLLSWAAIAGMALVAVQVS